MSRSRIAAAAAAAALLGGCMVGPDYQRPKQEQTPEKWAGLDPAVADAATTSHPVDGVADLTRWWASFQDPVLTSLVERAAIGNLDLVAAQARIRQARARRGIAVGGFWPAVDAFASAAHAPDFTDVNGGIVDNGNLFTAGFDANWEIDIFGRIRRGIEATEADVGAAIADRRDVWITLAAEVASTYAQLRASQEQLRIVEGNLAAQQDTRELTRRLFDAGLVGALDVANATAQVEATMSRIPVFRAAVRESIYALSVLLGRAPAELLAELTPPAPIPGGPAKVPVGLPSELLERRPDIRRASAQLHAATARVGVAIADQFPRLTLTAAVGAQSGDFGDFVGLASKYWSVGAGVVWPIFRGGAIQSNIELQKAVTDEALAAYRQQVLVAFKEVEVALVRYTQEQSRRAALARTVEANREAVSLATALYTAGRTDFLNVLAVQRALLDSQEALAASDRAVADGLIALYKSLGGGWELIEEDPPATPVAQAEPTP